MVEPNIDDLIEALPRMYRGMLADLLSDRLKFLFNMDQNINSDRFILRTLKDDVVAWGIYYNHYASHLSEFLIVQDLLRRGKDAIFELDNWIKMWHTKYLYRTKIVTDEEWDRMSKLKGVNKDRAVLTFEKEGKPLVLDPKFLEFFEGIAVEILEETKEIACTSMIAKDSVMYALMPFKDELSKDEIPMETTTKMISAVVKRVKYYSTLTGPLVVLRMKSL